MSGIDINQLRAVLDEAKQKKIANDKESARILGVIQGFEQMAKSPFDRAVIDLYKQLRFEANTRENEDFIIVEILTNLIIKVVNELNTLREGLANVGATTEETRTWKKENEQILGFLKEYIDEKRSESEERERFK
jgi:hypothetical protein